MARSRDLPNQYQIAGFDARGMLVFASVGGLARLDAASIRRTFRKWIVDRAQANLLTHVAEVATVYAWPVGRKSAALGVTVR